MSDVNLSLLDGTIDDLADLEGFSPIPAGTHRCMMSFFVSEVGDSPVIWQKFTVIETIEMASISEEPPEAGKSAEVSYFLMKADGEKNIIGEGQLKAQLKIAQEAVGGSTMREIMDNAEGAEVIVTLGVRASRANPENKRNSVKSLTFA